MTPDLSCYHWEGAREREQCEDNKWDEEKKKEVPLRYHWERAREREQCEDNKLDKPKKKKSYPCEWLKHGNESGGYLSLL